MITKSTIEKIFDTAQIDEVVGDFVSLKQRGVNKIALCPFHNEKTPSFTVSPSKGIYKCFGCGAGGNSVNFIMEHEKYSYPEALKYLAKKYNIEIEEDESGGEDLQLHSERESQYVVLSYAQQHFTNNLLHTEEGKAIGYSYFKERGFTPETIEKFQLGYGLESWDAFTQDALKNAYQLEYLEKTGLTITKDNRHYDRFRGRVIFPIHNFTGKVIGFGGRILKPDANAAKYINSPESDIYEKRKVLYGIYFAKKAIASKDNCYLVEGYTDLITLYQAGVYNVVASSGTSLTEDQIQLIKRITKNITILYDGDAAGIKASFRGIDLILEEGMNVRIVLFPDGEDPDSFTKKVGSVALHEFIVNKAMDFIVFKAGLLLKESEKNPVKRTSLIREIVETIAVIPDEIARFTYIRESGKVLEISEEILALEINKLRTKRKNNKRRMAGGEDIPTGFSPKINKSGHPMQDERSPAFGLNDEPQERYLIGFLLIYANTKIKIPAEDSEDKNAEGNVTELSVAEYIVNEVNDSLEFNNPVYSKIFREVERSVREGQGIDQNYFVNHSDKNIATLSIDLIFSPYTLSANWEKHHIYVHSEAQGLKKAVERAVYSLKRAKVKIMISENREKIRASKDETLREDLLHEYHDLLEAKKYIDKYLGIEVG